MKNPRIQRDLERTQELRFKQARGAFSFPHIIDSTMRHDFMECEEKFHYGFIQHLRPRRVSIHLHAGGVYAKGLETARLALWRDGLDLETALLRAFEAMLVAWGDFPIVWSWDHPKEYKTLDRIICAVEYYFSVWPPKTDYLQPLMENGEPALEFTFALPIPGTQHPETGQPILYCGRTDLIGFKSDTLLIEDDKTATAMGPTWVSQWDLRSQFTGYAWAAHEYEYPVAGIIVRGNAIQKAGYKHQEAITYRPQWQIDRWLRQLQANVHRAIEAWKTGDYRLALDGACANFGGCAFKRLCMSENPQRWIEMEYERNIWDPLGPR